MVAFNRLTSCDILKSTAAAAVYYHPVSPAQVRGKRGNIVQTYPGVEYDFQPNRVQMKTGDYIHIQWTGSDTNPNNNDGQGRQGTDRSNMILLRNITYDKEGALSEQTHST